MDTNFQPRSEVEGQTLPEGGAFAGFAPTPQKTELPKLRVPEPTESVQAQVKKWTNKINAAKRKYKGDFDRMKGNEEFVAGLQWPNQDTLDDDRYVANIILREINQGVASLYARNPKATAKRRERIEYTIWDGKIESLMQAAQAVTAAGPQANPMAFAVIQDFIQCEQKRQLIDLVAQTLETAYAIQIDRQEPDFKLQMKQLVRRIKVCGVGFVRVCFKREGHLSLTPSQIGSDIVERIKILAALVSDYDEKKFDDTSAKYEQIRQLTQGIHYSLSNPSETLAENEKLVFEFPSACSVIVDPRCRMLKGFVGANWIAQEYLLPADYVKAFFEHPNLKVGGSGNGYAKSYSMEGREEPPNKSGNAEAETYLCVWEFFNKQNRSTCWLCDGFDDYLSPPEEPTPCIQRFWPLISITFNDIETEPQNDTKVSIYPPSDVDLLKSPQKAWNKAAQRLNEHRNSNRPASATPVGALTDEDKEALKGGYPVGAVIEIRGMAPGQKVTDFLQPLPHSPIDPALYDKAPLERDIQLVSGSQQAVLGPISSKGTATEATISEQSRLSSTGSNVDDIDDLLTELARVGGEMMLREMSTATIKRDVGPGAVWSEFDREGFISRITLEINAASTGRPNKGLEIANFERLAPILMQAGVNPVFIVEEGVKRLDDRLDFSKAFPLVPIPPIPHGAPVGQPPVLPGSGPSTAAKGSPSAAVPNETSAGAPIPLPAATSASASNT